jgi:predicted metal-binding membrane protein
LIATLAQWGLLTVALISPMMESRSDILGGALLLAAGLFQFTSLKDACLAHCRSPIGFFLTEWRDGPLGAFRMGLKHGSYCLGCCWALMGLLFAFGVMNLLWVATISAFILLEKMTPAARWISRFSGALFLGWGGWLLFRHIASA